MAISSASSVWWLLLLILLVRVGGASNASSASASSNSSTSLVSNGANSSSSSLVTVVSQPEDPNKDWWPEPLCMRQNLCDRRPSGAPRHGSGGVGVKFSGKMGNNLGQYWMAAHLSNRYGNGHVAVTMDKGTRGKLNMVVHQLFPNHPHIDTEREDARDGSALLERGFVTPARSSCTAEVTDRVKTLGLSMGPSGCYACRELFPSIDDEMNRTVTNQSGRTEEQTK